MKARRAAVAAACASLACAWAPGARAADTSEARVSLDVRDTDVREVAGALLKVGGLQSVFDPEVACRLTLKVHELSWLKALQATLSACGLGYEEEGAVVRVATRERLRSELASQRQLAELRQEDRPGRLVLVRLSHARAREMAPLIKKLLSPHADVVYDDRTNTLILVD